MKYLLLAILISLQALVTIDALAASSDQTQEQEQKKPEQDKADQDKEPDCD